MKKSLISAIKKLLIKLGAEEVEGNNLVEVIDNGADAIEGGGGSGGNEPLVVTFSGTTTGDDAACDKTWAEIQAAITAGRPLIMQYDYGNRQVQLLYMKESNFLYGRYTYVGNPPDPVNTPFMTIECSIGSNGDVNIEKSEEI